MWGYDVARMVRGMASAILVFLMAAAAFGAGEEKAIGKKAIEFSLADQFEQKWTWSKHWKGKPTVLVMSDWKGSDHATKWTSPLYQRLKDRVQFVAMADVSLAPSFLRGYLRDRFKDAYKNSVLLDWDGTVFTHYVVQPGLPNVLFVDAQGVVRLHTWGKGAQDHVESFAAELERLLTAP